VTTASVQLQIRRNFTSLAFTHSELLQLGIISFKFLHDIKQHSIGRAHFHWLPTGTAGQGKSISRSFPVNNFFSCLDKKQQLNIRGMRFKTEPDTATFVSLSFLAHPLPISQIRPVLVIYPLSTPFLPP
jgi:hypothetical protein